MVPISIPAYRAFVPYVEVLVVKQARIKVVPRLKRPLIDSNELVKGRFFD